MVGTYYIGMGPAGSTEAPWRPEPRGTSGAALQRRIFDALRKAGISVNIDSRLHPLIWRDEHAPALRSALLLDRDGVINEKIDGGYVLDYERNFRFVSEFATCARRFSEARIPIVVLSNQSCVGRGLITETGFADIMRRMIDDLRREGVLLSGYVICPHSPGDGCSCRKPEPGLFYSAASLFDLQLWNCPFVGDSPSDMAGARAAGCPGIFVRSGDPLGYKDAFRDAFSYISAGIAAA